MNNRLHLMYEVAKRHYLAGETMEAIAHAHGMSRSTVSRLLSEARAAGIVDISVRLPASSGLGAQRILEERFNVHVHVVPVRKEQSPVLVLEEVARVAGGIVSQQVESGAVVGVAWGTTLSAVSSQLTVAEGAGVTVVQLNGAASPVSSGIPYVGAILSRFGAAFSAAVVDFPVPAFFDHEETRRNMWAERTIQRVLELQQRCTVAVFGVGSLVGPLPSHVYSAGYFTKREQAALVADGVVGDVCTVLLRADGSWEDIVVNARATGPTPPQLSRIAQRVCVAAGRSKAAAVVGALRAGVVTQLVIDHELAGAVVEFLRRQDAKGA